jgi:hypothetical protein
MYNGLLILFIILLLALILAPFLGKFKEGMVNTDTNSSTNTTSNINSSGSTSGSTNTTRINGTDYDNYNHFNKSSYPTMFYGPNGGTARIIETPNNNTLVITNKNGTTEIYYINNNSSSVKEYYGHNGSNAKIIEVNGKKAIEINDPNGQKIVYYTDNVYAYSNTDQTINQYIPSSIANGSDYESAFSNQGHTQVNTVQGPSGNTYSSYDSSAYYNSLPKGIPKSMIPDGHEDLYILKSKVVPPVCPAPTIIKVPDENYFDVNKCPPCEPCGRCPEPSFECKRVPTYSAFNPSTMPIPILNDFSQFGM